MEEPRIGVYVCNCGTNIAKVVDCDAVAEAAAKLPGVVVARSYKYMCSNPGQEMIVQDIEEHSPRARGRRGLQPAHARADVPAALETAGLNPYLLEMANIREQCSWVHDDGALRDRESAGPRHGRGQPGRSPRAAGAHVGRHVPQHAGHRRRHRRADGGARTGRRRQTRLPRREAGSPRRQHRPRRPHRAVPRLGARHPDLPRHPRAPNTTTSTSCSQSRVERLDGFVGNFQATLGSPQRQRPRHRKVDVGSVIVCTGYKEFDAARITHYGYGKLPNVITSFEFEQMLRQGRIETKEGRRRSTSPSSTAWAAAARSTTATARASAA